MGTHINMSMNNIFYSRRSKNATQRRSETFLPAGMLFQENSVQFFGFPKCSYYPPFLKKKQKNKTLLALDQKKKK